MSQSKVSRLCRRLFKNASREVAAQMAHGRFHRNVKALQGEVWKGMFRRGIGDYRILLTADHATKIVTIHQISLRAGKTTDESGVVMFPGE